MSEPKPSFVHVSYIVTTAEKLFAALTDGKFTQEYWGGRIVESEWKKGAPVRFAKRSDGSLSMQGTVLECDPPSLLVYTWQSVSPVVMPATKVTFRIKQVTPSNVRLELTHEPHDAESQIHDQVREGWSAILSSLKSYLETGHPLEATQRWESENR